MLFMAEIMVLQQQMVDVALPVNRLRVSFVISLMLSFLSAACDASASPRPSGQPLAGPAIRRASRPACAPRQCPITLLRDFDVLTTNLSVDVCKREYGPLTLHTRCFEQSIPGVSMIACHRQ